MSAVERIIAAIDKLNKLKADSTPGPWELQATSQRFDPRYDDARIMYPARHPNDREYDRYLFRDGSYAEDSGGLDLADAELIVTLHATIDAQLMILTRAYNMAVMGREQVTNGEVALADAILGADS